MKNKIITKHILILIFVGVAFSLFLMAILEDGKLDPNIFRTKKVSVRSIYIGDVPISVEVADTVEMRRTGLSGRKNLQEGRGMLFIFEKSNIHGIWMKDMNFPIDIMWIDEEFNIVDIKSDAKPESYPEVFRPAQKSLYVIEATAGFLHANDIKIDQKVILKIF